MFTEGNNLQSSNKCSNLISQILKTIANFENKANITRQVLNDSRSFNINTIFDHLDIESKGYLTSDILLKYLTSNSIFCDLETVKMFISFYDCNHDGTLDLEEFKNLVLTQNTRSINNSNGFQNSNNLLRSDIEYTLIKLLVSEIKFANQMVHLLRQLSSEVTFNPWNLFKEIDMESRDNIIPEA